MKKNNLGFTLIEVLVALGICALGMLLIAQFVSLFSKSYQKYSVMTEVSGHINDVRVAFQGKDVCTNNLKDLVIDSSIGAENLLDRLQYFKHDGTPAGVLWERNPLVAQPNERFSKVSLVPVSALNADLMSAEIRFSPKTQLNGELSKDRTLPLTLRMSGNTIASCWTRNPAGTVSDELLCDALGTAPGRDLNSQGYCGKIKTIWVPGDKSTASCPVGKPLLPNAGPWTDCTVFTEADFVDPNTGLTVNFMDSTAKVLKRPTAIFKLDFQAKTCNCYEAIDLPEDQKAKMRCHIRCVDL